jgi:hypothetical protein
VIDPTLPGTFTFYQRAELNGNVVYSAQHSITVSCAHSSTGSSRPDVLAYASGETNYKITSPASTYTLLSAFVVSNSNCPVSALDIV